MEYLKKESVTRECTIIYVTHIFDGLNDWCTDLIYLKKNKELYTIPTHEIGDIYKYLLTRFKEEENNEKDKEELNIDLSSRNAGRYSLRRAQAHSHGSHCSGGPYIVANCQLVDHHPILHHFAADHPQRRPCHAVTRRGDQYPHHILERIAPERHWIEVL